MNKTTTIKTIRSSSRIKKTILNFRTNDDLKQDILKILLENNISPSELKEDDKSFSVGGNSWLKYVDTEKEEIISSLPYDIKGVNIKDYGENWIKTNYALYEVAE